MTTSQYKPVELTEGQRSFVERVIATLPPALHVLEASPGTGKGTAVVEVIECLSRTIPTIRALIVCPAAALVHQFAARVAMRSPTLTVEALTRPRYRELEAAAPIGGSPFGEATVAVVSIDVVKYTDVARGVLATNWDLLVVDEAHALKEPRWQVVNQLIAVHKAPRTVLMSASTIDTSQWTGAVVSTLTSAPSQQRQESVVRSIHPVPVNYTERERAAVEGTNALAVALEQAALPAVGGGFRQRAKSSLYALERSVREIRNRAAHGLPLDASESLHKASAAEPIPIEVLLRAEELLRLLDEVEVDSKSEALFRLVSTLLEASAARTVVIVSRFMETVEYLASYLSSREVSTRSLTTHMAAADIAQVLMAMSSPGVTVMTLASLQGLEFPPAGAWILYEAHDENTRVLVASRSHSQAPNHAVALYELAD